MGRMHTLKILIFALLSSSGQVPGVQSRRRVINFGPPNSGYDDAPTPNYFRKSGSMEEIMDSPKFKNKKSDISQNPDLWGDALAVYDKTLRNRGKQVDPNGNPIGFFKPGLFNPWNNPIIDSKIVTTGPASNGRTMASDQIKSDQIRSDIIGSLNNKQSQFPMTPPPPGSPPRQPQLILQMTSTPVEEMTVYDRFLKDGIISQEIYRKCGAPHPRGKVCFGVPSGCIEARMCRLIVTFSFEDVSPNHVTVHLAGEAEPNDFIAVAFSHDAYLGQDTIIYCINGVRMPDPKVAIYIAFADDDNAYTQKDKFYFRANIFPDIGYHKMGMMACSFNLSTVVYLDDGSSIDILEDPYYLMLAFGHYIDSVPINHTDYGSLSYRHLAQFSDIMVTLGEELRRPRIIYPASRALILFHVLPSVISSLFLIPAGMTIAKYGREVFGYPKIIFRQYRLPCWLFIHLATILLSIGLGGMSMVSILVEMDFTWRSRDTLPVMHSIFGTASMLLVPINCVCGMFLNINQAIPRSEENKMIANFVKWSHWTFGNLTYLCGVFCVVTAGSMTRAQAPCFVEYFGYLHLAIHIVTHLVMSYDTYKLVKRIDEKHLCQRALFGPMISWKKRDSPRWVPLSHEEFHAMNSWNGRRLAILFYFITSFLCTFAICVLMLLPVVLCR